MKFYMIFEDIFGSFFEKTMKFHRIKKKFYEI